VLELFGDFGRGGGAGYGAYEGPFASVGLAAGGGGGGAEYIGVLGGRMEERDGFDAAGVDALFFGLASQSTCRGKGGAYDFICFLDLEGRVKRRANS